MTHHLPTMVVALSHNVIVGHCAVIDETGLVYCGPIGQSVVTEGAYVYMHPDDYAALESKKQAGAMQDNAPKGEQ